MDIAVTIPPSAREHDGRRPRRCGRCGSQGFNVHQRASKSLKDPSMQRADVVRFICKRCRKTTRVYPEGVDAARQTLGLRHATILLYWLGLPYEGIREVVDCLGCPLSKATIWANVRASGLLGHRFRLRVDPLSLVIQPHPGGAEARLRYRGRPALVELAREGSGGLVLTVRAPQSEATRLVRRRLDDAARRLGLRVSVTEEAEAIHA
jgi:hypothetical protein